MLNFSVIVVEPDAPIGEGELVAQFKYLGDAYAHAKDLVTRQGIHGARVIEKLRKGQRLQFSLSKKEADHARKANA